LVGRWVDGMEERGEEVRAEANGCYKEREHGSRHLRQRAVLYEQGSVDVISSLLLTLVYWLMADAAGLPSAW